MFRGRVHRPPGIRTIILLHRFYARGSDRRKGESEEEGGRTKKKEEKAREKNTT